MKHELEFSPEELELYSIRVELQPHHQPEKLFKLIYKTLKAEVKAAGTHELIHLRADPSGFVLALRATKEEPTDDGELNVPI